MLIIVIRFCFFLGKWGKLGLKRYLRSTRLHVFAMFLLVFASFCKIPVNSTLEFGEILLVAFFKIGINSLQSWTATATHGVKEKEAQKD